MSPKMHFHSQSIAVVLTIVLWWGYFQINTEGFVKEAFFGLVILLTIAVVLFYLFVKATCDKCQVSMTREKRHRESGGIFTQREYAYEYHCPKCQRRDLIGWYSGDDSGSDGSD